MSAREHNKLVKAIAEAEMRKYSRETAMDELTDFAKGVKESAKGSSKPVKKQLAIELRALAKVLPKEAREIARDVRVEAIEIGAMDRIARMQKQAPKARPAPKQVVVPDRSPVVARAAVASPLPVAAAPKAAAAEEFVEPDLATLLASGMVGKAAEKAAGGAGGPKAEPGDKLRAEINKLEDQLFAKAKAGESAAELNNFLFKTLQPKVNLYAAEYLGSGAAAEMMDELIDQVQEIIRENASKPKAAGGAGGPPSTLSDFYSSFPHEPDAKVKAILSKKLADGHNQVSGPYAGLAAGVEFMPGEKAKVKKLAAKIGIPEREIKTKTDGTKINDKDKPEAGQYDMLFYMSSSDMPSIAENNKKVLAMVNGVTGWGFTETEMKQFLWHFDGNNPDWLSHAERKDITGGGSTIPFAPGDLESWRNHMPKGKLVPNIFILRIGTSRGAQRWNFEQLQMESKHSFKGGHEYTDFANTHLADLLED